MAVYNMNGNESNAYSLNGTQLQSAYDINGNDILSYSINNVVSYFRDRTLEVAGEINQLSDDWTSFIFITDQHGTKNKDHSQAISLYLLDNTPCTMIVLGGDYSRETWSKTEFDNHMRPYVESPLIDKIYAIFGNHETKGGTSYATTMAESLASIVRRSTVIPGSSESGPRMPRVLPKIPDTSLPLILTPTSVISIQRNGMRNRSRRNWKKRCRKSRKK